MPERNTTSIPAVKTNIDVPKSGCLAIRGKSVDEAIKILTFSPQKSAGIVKKVLDSAIANAEHNLGADIDELKVATIEVNEAPNFVRSRARAKGRGERIIKRNSHITIRVGDE